MRRSEPRACRARALGEHAFAWVLERGAQRVVGGVELEAQLEQPLQRRHAADPRSRRFAPSAIAIASRV